MKNKRLLGILFGGLILRIIYIQSRGIQYDDAFSILLSERSISEIIKGTAADTMPPSYYFLLHYWMLFNKEIWYIRIPGIILNTASIFILFRIIKEHISENGGLWAASLAAISPFMIYHAQDIRGYSMLLFCQISYLYFYLKLYFEKGNREYQKYYWVGLILSGTLAMYTHNLAVFFIITPLLFLIIYRDWKRLKEFCLAFFIIMILFGPWVWILIGQIDKIQKAFWTPRPGIVEIIQLITVFTATLPLPGWVLYGCVLFCIEIFIIIILNFVRLKDKKRFEIFILFQFIIPLLLLFIVSYIIRPIFIPRGAISSAMIYYGLAGMFINFKRNNITSYLIVFGFVICSISSLSYQLPYSQFPRSPFQEAISEIKNTIKPGNVVIHQNKLSYFPTIIYEPGLHQEFLGDTAGSINDTLAFGSQQALELFPSKDIQSAAGNQKFIYYEVFSKVIDEYKMQGEKNDPNLLWLMDNYQLIEKKQYNDLEIYCFSKQRTDT